MPPSLCIEQCHYFLAVLDLLAAENTQSGMETNEKEDGLFPSTR
jgi:hypothetical protein